MGGRARFGRDILRVLKKVSDCSMLMITIFTIFRDKIWNRGCLPRLQIGSRSYYPQRQRKGNRGAHPSRLINGRSNSLALCFFEQQAREQAELYICR
jgi:hypothetical protein